MSPLFEEGDRWRGQSVPLIHFATSSSTLLELMKRAGGDVIGVDWRVDIRRGLGTSWI